MSIQIKTSLYNEYRELCVGGQIHPTKATNSKIITSVIQLHLKIAQIACENFVKRKFTEFDPTIGDHNCHLVTHFVLASSNNVELVQEAQTVIDYVKSKKGKYQAVNEIKDFDLPISQQLKTLVSLALLNVATVCVESPDKPMVLKLDYSKIQHTLSKNCPNEVIALLLKRFRESLNTTLISHVQHLPTSTASLSLVETAKSVHDVVFRYVCATHSLKATLQDLYVKGSAFAIEHYGKTKQPTQCVFVPDGEFPAVKLQKPHQLDPKMPLMSIQMFFQQQEVLELASALEPAGILQFMLHSIAKVPQFADRPLESYAHHEDLIRLSLQDQTEIRGYREVKLPHGCQIVHTYPTTVEELCSRLEHL